MTRLWRAFRREFGFVGWFFLKGKPSAVYRLDWCGKPDMTPCLYGCAKGRFLGVELE